MTGMLRIVAAILATTGILLSMTVAAGAASITAVILRDLQPTSFVDAKTKQPAGFAVDLTTAIAAEIGLQVHYLMVDNWQEAEDALQSGQADICPVLVVNQERRAKYYFTDYTETSGVRIVIRTKSSNIAGLTDLYGRPVGTLRASQAYHLLKDNRHIALTFYDSFQQAIMELLAGRIDAFVGPDNIVRQLVREAGLEDQISMLEPPLIEIKRAIAVVKGNPELFQQLQGPTAAFVSSSAYKKLYSKWYGSPVPFWNTAKVALLLATITLTALIGLAIWRYFLLLGYNKRITDSERRFRGIFDQTLQMIGLLDTQGRLIEANQPALELIGATLEQVQGQVLWETAWWNHDPDQQTQLQETIEEAAKGQLGHMVAAQISTQGHKHYIDFSIKPVFDEKGRVYLLITEGRDITERVHAELSLHEKTVQLEHEIVRHQQAQDALQLLNTTLEQRIGEAVKQLRQKDDMLIQQSKLAAQGELLTNIAHQWRQPLNNIAAYIQAMQFLNKAGELTQEEMGRDIEAVMEILQYMSQTIDDFRSFFVRDRSSAQEFLLLPVIAKAIAIITPTLSAHNIPVQLLTDNGDDLRITGYPNEFAQVMMNLLYNARDALLERKISDPRIEIRVGREQGRTVVTVQDNGGGIEANVLPSIFDPYFTTKKPAQGTGIGLYMSKTIIEKNMGGTLTAGNTAEGAELKIRI